MRLRQGMLHTALGGNALDTSAVGLKKKGGEAMSLH
jgi:hypothetical protein